MNKDDIDLDPTGFSILKFDSWDTGIETVFNLLFISDAIFVIAIIYTGIMYITSAGDSQKATQAKKNLTWAITGFIVILLATSITRWIGQALNGTLGE